MSIFDIVLGALLLFGLVRGFMKGLFVEVASLLALVAGVYGAIHFSNYVGDVLVEKVDWDENYINLAAFAITFIIIVLAIALAGKALTKLADFAALGIVNKFLGGVFGAIKIGVILSVLLLFFDRINTTLPFADEEELSKSVLYEPVKSIVPMIFPDLLETTIDSDPEDNEEQHV